MEREDVSQDIVTGLSLYGEFVETARKVIDSDRNIEDCMVLVSTDISNFKYINRIYGYRKADELLRSLAGFITDGRLGTVISCRTHSDHIISFFKYNSTRDKFVLELEELGRSFCRKNSGKFSSVTLHLNNGVYFVEDRNEDLAYSIDKANVARRIAKGNYLVNGVVFEPYMMGRKEEDAKILALFDSALKKKDIRIFYQPKIDIATGRIVGAEALSRMYDRGKLVCPDIFIPVLENSGKVVDLDRYVMSSVFSAVRKWMDAGIEPVVMSINLSRMHFYEKNVADTIYELFKKYDIPTRYIEFELTESLFFDEIGIIKSEVNKLRSYGFKISMDDFGVGYSNLNSLGELPVDIIKFDKGFVKSSMANEASYQIMLSLINVFRKINYDVICEGVETRADEKMIFECGCDVAQGFLYDKPMELSAFEEKYLAARAHNTGVF